jgi:hypothetical protein
MTFKWTSVKNNALSAVNLQIAILNFSCQNMLQFPSILYIKYIKTYQKLVKILQFVNFYHWTVQPRKLLSLVFVCYTKRIVQKCSLKNLFYSKTCTHILEVSRDIVKCLYGQKIFALKGPVFLYNCQMSFIHINVNYRQF